MNIKEIAKLAGVSASTVSKIMNQKDESISPDTRARVLKIVKEYNYIPYSSAGVQNTRILGIVLRSSISFDTTLDGMIQAAQKDGYTTIVCNSNMDPDQEYKNISSLCGNRVGGIIWEPVRSDSLALAGQIQSAHIPFLTTGPDGGDDALCLPYDELGYQLTNELIIRKHRQIACLPAKGRRVRDFLAGYQKCLFDHNIPFLEQNVYYELDDRLIYQINTHQISGVISSHYSKALEFYQLMNTLHYRVPEDFSLIALRNDCTEAPSIPCISTYTVANAAFGSYLCRKLIAKIEKSPQTSPIFFQGYELDNDATLDVPFNMNKKKILVVGNINVDTYLNVPNLPRTGKTFSTSDSSVYPGGKGLNQAVGVAKLNQPTALLGNVGSDLASDNIFRLLHDYGIDTSGIKRRLNYDTGKAYIFLESSGDSIISIVGGANNVFSPEDIRQNERLFEGSGYCLIQSEIPMETVQEACMMARKHGVKTIFKPSACSSLPALLYPYINILIPNEEELQELCPEDSPMEQKIESLIARGTETVIVTLGERGCIVHTGTESMSFPAARVTSIDNTGASDAFISTLAVYLLEGCPLAHAVKIAMYAAGFCVSREGVIPALIDRNSLESHIRQVEPELLLPTASE